MRKLNLKAGRTGSVCGFILLQIVVGATFAHGAETSAPASMPAVDAAKDSGPFGGCEPIGMTASGELVFPLECKHKIKLPAAPVASEEQAPAAAAEAKPAVTEDKPAMAPEKAAIEDQAVETTAAKAVEDKPATASAAPATPDAKAAAISAALASTDKMPAAAARGPAGAKPAEPAAKAASEKPAGRRGAKIANAGKEPVAKQPVAKQVAAVVKSLQAIATPSHAKQQQAAVQTASAGPACTHFRSYNPVSKSYLGFDGHHYACR